MTTLVQLKSINSNVVLNDNYCTAMLPVSACARSGNDTILGERDGSIFRVGDEFYFVPTHQVADDDILYIACDAQKIEGPMDGWRSQLALGDMAGEAIEDAIVDHLYSSLDDDRCGESFVITRDGKTFRL